MKALLNLKIDLQNQIHSDVNCYFLNRKYINNKVSSEYHEEEIKESSWIRIFIKMSYEFRSILIEFKYIGRLVKSEDYLLWKKLHILSKKYNYFQLW